VGAVPLSGVSVGVNVPTGAGVAVPGVGEPPGVGLPPAGVGVFVCLPGGRGVAEGNGVPGVGEAAGVAGVPVEGVGVAVPGSTGVEVDVGTGSTGVEVDVGTGSTGVGVDVGTGSTGVGVDVGSGGSGGSGSSQLLPSRPYTNCRSLMSMSKSGLVGSRSKNVS
jgi:hypothetical protein